MRDAWRIARHEWSLILKEPRFLFLFVLTPLILLGLQAATLWGKLGSAREILELARSLLLMLAVLAPSAAVPLGADSFAGEKERNTLEILMCLPVGMGPLFWGKIIGMLPFPIAVGWIGQGLLAAMLASRGYWDPGFGIHLAKAMALTPALALFLCALTTLLSLIAESVRSAAQLSSLAMLLLFFLAAIFSSAYLRSPAVLAGALAALTLGAAACFLAARRRFPRVL
jgi:ABC-type transport system involved in multi-copper enzyme maturation permease subunit